MRLQGKSVNSEATKHNAAILVFARTSEGNIEVGIHNVIVISVCFIRTKMVSCSQICDVVLTAFFEYDTAKIVHIKSKKVGLINRLIQLAIIVYIIG